MGSKERQNSSISISAPDRSLLKDERAIEGLPVRLVIALVIGVASLGVMLQILGGIDTFEQETEVDVELESGTIDAENEPDDFTVTVVDEDGNTVPDATVIAIGDDARLDSALDAETDSQGEAQFDSEDEVELPPDADVAEIRFEIRPPSDANWVDDQPNSRLIVTR